MAGEILKSQTKGLVYNNTPELHLDSYIVGAPSSDEESCYPPVQENLYMWFEDRVGIIWSCRQEPMNTLRHEEAVLLVIIPDKSKEVNDNTVKNLRIVAEKYLPSLLLTHINWTEIRTTNVPNSVPFFCAASREREKSPALVIFLAVGMVCLMVTAVIMSWKIQL